VGGYDRVVPKKRSTVVVEIRTFSGKELEPYIPEIAKLRIEVFKEWPYLYEGNLDSEKKYLKKFTECKESFFAVAFDGDRVVGISSGLPLQAEDEATKKPFLNQGLSVEDYFYFSESVLKKEYRGQGIGHKFFDARETFAKDLGRFKKVCFCGVVRDPSDPRKPEEFKELKPFWNRRGYSPIKDVVCAFSWKEIGMSEETEKPLQCWEKSL